MEKDRQIHSIQSIARPTERFVRSSALLACAAPAVALATICIAPFLNKPFNIDDSEYLMMASQIVKHPMHPMDFNVCWNTIDSCTKLYQLTPGNSLMGYALVPTVLTGSHEWTAHLTQLIFVWIAVIAMTSFVLRLGWDKWHTTVGALLLVAIPPFLPMACTAMPDILATAVTLVGMERLAAWKDEQRWTHGTSAAMALGLAGFARPHLVLLLPLGALFLLGSIEPRDVLSRVRRNYKLWLPVIAGCGVLAASILAVREHNLAITSPAASLIRSHLWNNIYAFFLYFAFPLPLGMCWLANRLSARRLWTVFGVIACALLPVVILGGPGWVLFFVVVGLSTLASLLMEAAKHRDHTLFVLMLWMLIPLPIVFYSHLPMKYLLPCMPAVILVCLRLLDGVSTRFARVAAVVLIIAGTGYSLLIVRADADFAEFGRDALAGLIKPHVAAGETVWYPGQYWSFWYAPLDGAKLILPEGPQPKAGDLLVVDVFGQGDVSPLKRYPHRTMVQTISHTYRFGRTMGAGKGLYANGWGYWLWGFGVSDKDRFELWRIQ